MSVQSTSGKQRKRRRAWVLSLAIAAVPLVAALAPSPAYAQFPTGNDGRARDANNRVGSGGYNDAGPSSRGRPYTSNQVAEGNVTRGLSFRGAVFNGDPRAFRGETAGRLSDLFIRESAGVTDLNSPGGLYTPTTFYGRSRAVPPPPGSVAAGATGAFLGGTPPDAFDNSRPFLNYRSTDSVYERQDPYSRYNQDRILQVSTPGAEGQSGNETGTPSNPNGPLTLSASPLYGVRQFGPNDRTSAQDFFNARTRAGGERRDAFGIAIDDAAIQQMQRELSDIDPVTGRRNVPNPNEPNGPQGQGDRNGVERGGRTALPPGAVQSLNPQPLQPLGGPQPQGRGGAANGPNAGNAGFGGQGGDQPEQPNGAAQPIQSDQQPREGVSFRTVVPAAQQTPAYRNLMARYQRASRQGEMTPQEQARWYNQLRRAQQQGQGQAPAVGDATAAARPGQPGSPGAGGLAAPAQVGTGVPGQPDRGPGSLASRLNPQQGSQTEPQRPALTRGGAAAPGGNAPAPAPGATTGPADRAPTSPGARQPSSEKPDKPVQIKSLAEGVKAPGLRDLLQSAEQNLKEGKYDSAIDQYEAAQRVAVNNPLIALGQAHAELAATYYRRAEATLRRAVAEDPALLYGQYDLRTFIGQERLDYVVGDLKDLSAKNPRDVRPVLLLAYIAYNMGLEQQAATFLDDAARRAGGRDETVDLLRRHWTLPTASGAGSNAANPAPDLNK